MANFLTNLFTSGSKPPKVSSFKEAGVNGAQIVGGWLVDRERNPKLSFLQRSTRYEEIMSNIAVVGAGVRYFTSLGASAVWSVKPAEDDKDEMYADFMRLVMDDISQSWSSVVKSALMYRYMGLSVGEMTAYKAEDGNIRLKSIDNRPARTIQQFDQDETTGNIRGFGQYDVNTGNILYIPREKCLYVVDNLIDDSPAGMGVLRHVFESCERLKVLLEQEIVGFAKDLRGIPIGRVPYAELSQAVNNNEITEEQAKAAIAGMEALIRAHKKLPETGIMLDSKPYVSRSDTGMTQTNNRQWDIELLQGQSPGLAEVGKAIERTQKEIARVLSSEAQMLDGAGSNALSKDKSSNAYLAVNAAIHDVVDAANKDIISFVWKLNGFDTKLMPKFAVEDISDKDAESVATVLKDMATAGAVLSPDDPVINDLRSMLGVSALDLDEVAAQMLEDQQAAAQQMQVGV